jgi:hypothetical protein
MFSHMTFVKSMTHGCINFDQSIQSYYKLKIDFKMSFESFYA